ncbi:MAG: AraC family transcriptional regulator [Acetobacter sp.]|jgi:AraC-like DNA-binding protein|nr:AraC family transcriptional regulator [Acetobacter sp.]MCH4060097.1 AraC family transcriptional regulator [Acetobacter sp.]MCH4087037.1 AraC family transcriptional regulator [Acetobacter sp.]MCI1292857.1 AraC family transcriptional regulator [Acetobacter sp.]MCI1319443.1 AraC family transcriptional regulator [Acetobacter sp.]
MNTTLHDIQTTVARLCPGKAVRTNIDFLTLYSSTRKTDPVLFVYEPRIYIVIQGQKEISVLDRHYIYDETHYLVSTIDIPVSGMITKASPERPYLAMCISFSATEIFEIISLLGHSLKPALSSSAGMGLSALSDDLLDAVRRLLTCLATPSDATFLAPRIKQEIIYRILQGDQGSTLYDIANARSDLSGINRAILFLREHFLKNFEITTLPELAGMSQSKFYKKFHDMTNLTPLQYRQLLRLQEARRLMLHTDLPAAEAGFRVGYESPSQFSREYRRVFGQPPAADMKRIRAIGANKYREDNEEVWV